MPTIAGELKLATSPAVVWAWRRWASALASPLGGWCVDRYGPARRRAIAMLVGGVAWPPGASRSTPSLWAGDVRLRRAHRSSLLPFPGARGHVDTHKLARANGLALLAYTLHAITVLTARTAISLRPWAAGASPWSSPHRMGITGVAGCSASPTA